MSKKKRPLRGMLTALVTPMNSDGSVDFGALDALIDWQVQEGVDGLVPCGTTGESATMTAEERESVIARVVERAGDKVTVVAGAGSNSTAVAVEHQKRAAATGAAYALVVTPYYNKPTPEGLYRHYEALLRAADIPIIMYNVPSRTGCDMKPDTVERLASLQGIAAIKEATADLLRVALIRGSTPADFVLLSGDDFTASPFCMLGGDGVISVSSNVVPKKMTRLIHAALDGRLDEARAIDHDLQPLFSAMFLQSNPIPVKAALAIQGRIKENYRLPLCEMDSGGRSVLKRVVEALA